MTRRRAYPGRERRRDTRVELKIPVDYSSVDAFFTDFSANINEGGIFIEMEKPVDLDTTVMLQFRLPGIEDRVKVIGRVAWIRDDSSAGPSGVGIEFQDLPPDMREVINTVVRGLRRTD